MNELQKIEFEMLEAFVNVCEKLNLRYYLVCGSALGAVKYGGFIPWDDDVDVALPRADYEIFCTEAPKYLPKHIFLQNYRTDKNFLSLGSKLRNSCTTYVETAFKETQMHHGAFIDVFPIDGYILQIASIEKIKKVKAHYDRIKAVHLFYSKSPLLNLFGIRTSLIYFLHKVFGFYSNTTKYIEACEKVISQHPDYNCDVCCNHADCIHGREYEPSWHYGDGTWSMFEGLKVRIPEKYDDYLTNRYGDWRADLPDDQKVGHHYYEIMDLERPYTDYIEKVYKGGRKIKLSKTPISK